MSVGQKPEGGAWLGSRHKGPYEEDPALSSSPLPTRVSHCRRSCTHHQLPGHGKGAGKAALLNVCVPVTAQGKEGALSEARLISCPNSPSWCAKQCSLLYSLQFLLPCKIKASAAPFLPLRRLSADHVEQMLLPQMFSLSLVCIYLRQTLQCRSARVPAVAYPNLLLTSALV